MTDRGVIWSVLAAVVGLGLAQFGGPLWPAALEAAGRAADLAVQKLDLAAEGEEESALARLALRAAAGRVAPEARRAALGAPEPRNVAAALEDLVPCVPPAPEEVGPVEVCTREGVIVRIEVERQGARRAPAAPGSDA